MLLFHLRTRQGYFVEKALATVHHSNTEAGQGLTTQSNKILNITTKFRFSRSIIHFKGWTEKHPHLNEDNEQPVNPSRHWFDISTIVNYSNILLPINRYCRFDGYKQKQEEFNATI